MLLHHFIDYLLRKNNIKNKMLKLNKKINRRTKNNNKKTNKKNNNNLLASRI